MLSIKVQNMLARIKQATEELDELIQKETDGKYSLCIHPDVQFYADRNFKHSLNELEEFVGPLQLHYADGECKHYNFTLNNVPCVIVLYDEVMDDGSVH